MAVIFEGSGVRIPAWGKIFLSQIRPDILWDPSSLLCSGYWASFPGEIRQGREVYQSHPSNSEVKSEWNFSSPPPTHLPRMDKDNSSFLTLKLSAQPWKIRMASALPTVRKNGKSGDSASLARQHKSDWQVVNADLAWDVPRMIISINQSTENM